MTTTVLLTPGKMAAEIGVPLHRGFIHISSTRPPIQPVALAGLVQMNDRTALEAVRTKINRIVAERLLREVSA